MTTHGLVVGKFAPLTRGHVSFIFRAADRVDELHVVLCYDEKFLTTLPEDMSRRLSLRNRHLWLLETFAEHPSIHVSVVDETPVAEYPAGAADFTKLVRDQLKKSFGDITLTHSFSSEPSYDDYFGEFFPETRHIIVDAERKLVPISATEVRDSPYDTWLELAPAARKDFVYRVVVIGCESTGKSTLVKQLAGHYATTYVPEVGRNICEDEFYSHEEYMTTDDYVEVAYAHKMIEKQALKRANRVLISDTNNLITEFSAELMGKHSRRLVAMSHAEKYDLVLYLDIDVPWVGDNLRRNGDPTKRKKTNALLREMCDKYNVQNITTISGSYEQRFMQAVAAIDKLIGVTR